MIWTVDWYTYVTIARLYILGQSGLFWEWPVNWRLRFSILIGSILIASVLTMPVCVLWSTPAVATNVYYSGSIKDRAVQFAYSRRFVAMADRMVWPPSLSRDRKWSRPPNRRTTAAWPRVTPLVTLTSWNCWQGARKCVFGITCITCSVRTKNFNTFHYFLENTRNFLFPQCKTSIGNNSGSIRDIALQFAYRSGFSEMADRMVWPPYLSRDRKWPRPPIQRITAPWPRVNDGILAGTVDNEPENVFQHRLHHLCVMNKI